MISISRSTGRSELGALGDALELEQRVGVVLRISVALSCRLAVEKRAQVLTFMRAAAGEENFALASRSAGRSEPAVPLLSPSPAASA